MILNLNKRNEMKKSKVKELKNGVYRIYWKSGGYSVASIGRLPNGDVWLAPSNWTEPSIKMDTWKSVKKVKLIEVVKRCH